MPSDNEFTRILQWPGYGVYRQRIDEKNKILELCRKFADADDSNERAVGTDLGASSEALYTSRYIE